MLVKVKERICQWLKKPFLRDWRTLLALWLLLAVVASVLKYERSDNNFLIYKYVFWHVINELPLYIHYPAEYNDLNHYGPVFAYVIAPFAVVPRFVGLLLWNLVLALGLYVSVRRSTFSDRQQLFVLWFCAHDLLTCLFMQQFNIAIAAIIVASYWLVEREREWAATFLIVLGTFVKLLGIVGIVFFLFSRHKGRFVAGLLLWSVVMFVAPMLIASPDYIVGCYGEWYQALIDKNASNSTSWGAGIYDMANNISTLGMVRRFSGNGEYSDLLIILPAMVLAGLPLLRRSQWRFAAYRETLLAQVLLFSVLFSTGSESSSYVIAFVGMALWYTAAPWQRTRWDVALMVFVFVLASLGNTDLYPPYIRKYYVQAYSLKALPCTIVWLQLCYEMMVRNYGPLLVRRDETPIAQG